MCIYINLEDDDDDDEEEEEEEEDREENVTGLRPQNQWLDYLANFWGNSHHNMNSPTLNLG